MTCKKLDGSRSISVWRIFLLVIFLPVVKVFYVNRVDRHRLFSRKQGNKESRGGIFFSQKSCKVFDCV